MIGNSPEFFDHFINQFKCSLVVMSILREINLGTVTCRNEHQVRNFQFSCCNSSENGTISSFENENLSRISSGAVL